MNYESNHSLQIQKFAYVCGMEGWFIALTVLVIFNTLLSMAIIIIIFLTIKSLRMDKDQLLQKLADVEAKLDTANAGLTKVGAESAKSVEAVNALKEEIKLLKEQLANAELPQEIADGINRVFDKAAAVATAVENVDAIVPDETGTGEGEGTEAGK